MHRLRFHKGHGTMNDFILFTDSEGFKIMDPDFIKLMADRRAGIGADGVIRAVRAGVIEEWDGDPDLWFMDYYNADGSTAEMCGNGLRVFAMYLWTQQLTHNLEFDVATRAGLRHVALDYNRVTVGLGKVTVANDTVRVTSGEHTWEATPVDVGNPHAVSFVSEDELAALRLDHAPTWDPAERFPNGVNMEFVAVQDATQLSMRVHERGSGETMSCGTGVVASAAAHRARTGVEGPIQVRVPGGDLVVRFDGEEATLTGPAVIVGDGTFWL